MGLFDFIKGSRTRRKIRDAEWEVGSANLRGLPDALAQLGRVHYDAGFHEKAADAYEDAAKAAVKSRMPILRKQSLSLQARADEIRDRFNLSA